jgi:uncharacterized protein YbjQ (UPF0145 family)
VDRIIHQRAQLRCDVSRAGQMAVDEMMEHEGPLGANAVVGVDLDYGTIGPGSLRNMLMVSACGTAAVIAGL